MSFDDLPYELILEVQSFLCSNKETTALKQINKFCNWTSKKYGYLKELKLYHYTSPLKFIVQYHANRMSLEYVHLNCIIDAMTYMNHVKWTKHIMFSYCGFGDDLIDPEISDTETLYLSDERCVSTSTMIHVNWAKLPKLKTLSLDMKRTINLDGLELCKELQLVNIVIAKPTRLPDCIAKLPNLRSIATNCYSNESLHFVSPELRVCFIKKGVPFTAVSTLVPWRHLEVDYFARSKFL
jgi:hypothetical protein